jgi:phospholipid-translocating ATPase
LFKGVPCDVSGVSSSYAAQQVRPIADAIDRYSQLGLRTMCLAWRDLEENEYAAWSLKFKEASMSLMDREWKIAEVCQLLEKNLELLGATAIEDKLQVENRIL